MINPYRRFAIMIGCACCVCVPPALGQSVFTAKPKVIKSIPFTISQPGTYILSSDVKSPGGGFVILINSDHVVLDMQSFSVIGPANFDTPGIDVSAGHSGILIRGGIVRNFSDSGIRSASPIEINGTTAALNGGHGFNLASGCEIINANAFGNQITGIDCNDNGVIRNCNVSSNQSVGILGGFNCHVTDCTIQSNAAGGILFSNNAHVASSTVVGNVGNGVVGGASSIVNNLVVRNNTGAGIVVGPESVVANNFCTSNGSGTGAGITTAGDGSEFDSNLLIGNGIGLQISAAGNLIHHNRAHANGTDYSIVGGNDIGPIGPAATSTTSWSNVSY